MNFTVKQLLEILQMCLEIKDHTNKGSFQDLVLSTIDKLEKMLSSKQAQSQKSLNKIKGGRE